MNHRWMFGAPVLLCGLFLIGCGGENAAPKTDAAVNRNVASEMKVDIEWVSIPAGPFTMGSNDYQNKSDRERKVNIKKPYEMMKTPVTNGMYRKWLETVPAAGRDQYMPQEDRLGLGGWKNGWYPEGKADFPVTNVTYKMADAYAKASGWRIPSSAMWEKAARGDKDTREYPWGNEANQSNAHYGDSRGEPARVGEHSSGESPYGATDMSGNVWEWTTSWYDDNNPGRERVLAGGSFGSEAAQIKVHTRKSALGKEISPENGFRCARLRE